MDVHVKTIKSTNPNIDVHPVDIPFIGSSLHLTCIKVETVFWDISDIEENDSLKERFSGFTEIDEVYGMKIWNGKGKSSNSLENSLKSRSFVRLIKFKGMPEEFSLTCMR